MSTPLISVCVVTYNHADYIEDCLNSILNQSYSNFEVIVVDDCSTDDTISKIKSFDDTRIRLFTKSINKGISDSTKIYMEFAEGEYVSALGGDDIFLNPDKLSIQLKAFENNSTLGAVFSEVEFINETGDMFQLSSSNSFFRHLKKVFAKGKFQKNNYDWLRYFFYEGNCICGPSMLVRTDLLKQVDGFDYRYEQLQDFDTWIKFAFNNYHMTVLETKLTGYRIRDNNANLSNPTPLKKRKIVYEHSYILRHYLQMNSMDQFKSIFPDYVIQGKEDPLLIPFYLSQIAFNQNSDVYFNFGIEALHSLFENYTEELGEKLLENYNFSLRDYYNIMSKNPLGLRKYPDKKSVIEFFKNVFS